MLQRKTKTPTVVVAGKWLNVGGAAVVAVNLANGFAEKGYNTQLVLLDNRNGVLQTLVAPDISIHDLRGGTPIWLFLKIVWALWKIRPTYLISNVRHACIIIAACLFSPRTKVIVRQNVNPLGCLNTCPNLCDKLLYRISLATYGFTDAVVANSEGVRTDLKRYVRHRVIEVIHNPVMGKDWEIKSHQNAALPGIPDTYILAVARLHPEKDLRTLIKAFAQVRQKVATNLLILGEGVERQHLAGLIREFGLEQYIVMPGVVENPWPYYRKASVLALSSLHEGFGNVIVEALACGVPVVSTDCPSGPREILDNGRFGRLVPVGDAAALADAILETLGEEQTGEMKKMRYNRALEFTIDKSVARYEKLLLGLTSA